MTPNKNVWIFLLILVSSFVLAGNAVVCSAVEGRVTVLLPASVNVEGPELLLGNIAEITGPEELAREVANINAGAAPISGSSRRLTKGQIEVRLRQGGLDPELIEFQGATTVQVYGVAPRQGVASTSQALTGFPSYDVVVAVTDLPRGHVIVPADLVVETQEFRSGQPDPRSVEDFVGLRTSRHVIAGSALTTLNVEVVPIVERGTPVTILVQTSSLVVSAPGIARGSGGLGEVIAVENTLSRQVVAGEIIDAQTVQVNMRGSGTP